MPRNKYPEVTEKAILDTAKRLFLEHGYEHVTLQDIAEACGLTRGAIYHHFHGDAGCRHHLYVPRDGPLP